jgi:L-threonylcarbamoyladenylate synthase
MVTVEDIQMAAEILRSGGLVVFPTETVYGLGANALDASAVRKVYELKGRPANSPLIVHVASVLQARELAAEWPEEAEQLARDYWPGPLTLVVPKKSIVPDEVTAGLQTVGLRIPRHPVALDLLRAAGLPIAAPSANRFTQLSPTNAAHVRKAFGNKTPFLLDGGECEVGIESTVMAVTKDGLEVLRPGMAMVKNATTASDEGSLEAHRAPGQHKKHYSPKTRVLLVTAGHLPKEGRGAYLSTATQPAESFLTECMPTNADAYAKCLYKVLHELDGKNLDWIAIEMPPKTPEWAAIRDRLTRAAY